MGKLTLKQEKFVLALVEGKSQRQAYKEAYNAKNMKDETIDSRASKLFKEYKISARYQELIKEVSDKALYTREEAIEDLKWVKERFKESIEVKPTQGNGTIFVNAVKELCTLNDLYPKEKEEKDNKENEVADMLNKVIEEIKNV